MKLSLLAVAAVVLGAQSVSADSLRTQVQDQLVDALGGTSNCLSKCQGILEDPGSKDPSASEYACSVGCDYWCVVSTELSFSAAPHCCRSASGKPSADARERRPPSPHLICRAGRDRGG